MGLREQVWNETAYKTTGGLLKHDLMINKLGNIVSKRKFLLGKTDTRLQNYNNKKINYHNRETINEM